MMKRGLLFLITAVMSFMLVTMYNRTAELAAKRPKETIKGDHVLHNKRDIQRSELEEKGTEEATKHMPYKWVVNPPPKVNLPPKSFREPTALNQTIGPFESNFKNPCWFVGPPSVKNLRCVPYFYMLGVGKSGSSSLYICLNKHPEIAPAGGKELSYWDGVNGGPEKGPKNVAEYYTRYFRKATEQIYTSTVTRDGIMDFHYKITYDNTPRNVWYSWLPEEISKVYNKTKLIIIMRNPIERSYSHYHHGCVIIGRNCTPEFYHASVVQETNTFQKCLKTMTIPECWEKQRWGHAQIKTSLYYGYVKFWVDRFPSDQLLFIKAEDFYKNVTKVMDGVFQFLGLESVSDVINAELEESMEFQRPPGLKVFETPLLEGIKNATEIKIAQAHAKQKWHQYQETMLPKTKTLLDDFFAPYNKMLADLLGDDRFLFQDKT